MPNSERFKLIVQGELSFAVEFDGQHMDEWSERDGAEAYIEFWSGKLTLERAEARRAQIVEDCKSQCQYCAGVKDELESVNPEPYWTEQKYFCNSGEMEGFIHATSWGTAVSCDASALRSKLAAPSVEQKGIEK